MTLTRAIDVVARRIAAIMAVRSTTNNKNLTGLSAVSRLEDIIASVVGADLGGGGIFIDGLVSVKSGGVIAGTVNTAPRPGFLFTVA